MVLRAGDGGSVGEVYGRCREGVGRVLGKCMEGVWEVL